MDTLLVFAILGLGAGALSAALGVGLVMTYRGAGVINFGHAAVSLWGAFAYIELRTTGDVVLPLVIVPSRVSLGSPPPVWLAMLVALLLAAVLGTVVHLLVFRPLRSASLVAKVIASLGLLTIFQNLLVRRFGDMSRSAEPLFPTNGIQLGDLMVPADRLWLAGAVLALAVVISAIYRWTTFGLATRGALEDEGALILCRRSPTVVAMVNVALGVAITTAAMIGSASISPLNPYSVSLLVVPGLTAMLVGGLTSVSVAAVAGLALGVLQGELSYVSTQSWWPQWLASAGVADSLPLLVIIAVLMLRGKSLPTRVGVTPEPLPPVPPPMRTPVIVSLAVVLAVIVPIVGPEIRIGITTSMVYAVLALSLVVLVGLVGQVSLGQFAIAGVAAFALAKHLDSLPFPLGIVISSAFAAVVAVIVGLPALRVRGTQLAVITLAAAVGVQSLVLNNAASNTGKPTTLEQPTLGPLNLSSQVGTEIGRLPFVYAVLVILVVVACLTSILIGRPLGRRFLAVRSNEQAAASVGIDVSRTKAAALGIAGLFAGVGGGLLAYNQQAISSADFGVFAGVLLLVYAYLGGITSVGGALYAGFLAPAGVLFAVLNEFWTLGGRDSLYELIGAFGLILMAVLYPRGSADGTRLFLEKVRGPQAKRASPPVRAMAREVGATPSLAEDGALLAVDDITVRYGGMTAVDGASFAVAPGEIVGVIGPNGAGKTSLVDAVTGFTRAQGTISLGDQRIELLRPHDRLRMGLARTWQGGQLFDDLSVEDNLRVASRPSPHRGDRTAAGQSDPGWTLDLLGIADLVDDLPTELSGGQRKLVGLARALASCPRFLLADEPAAGLDSFESQQLGEHLIEIARTGVGILLIEHDLALVLRICDRVYVLDQGVVIASGTPDEVRENPAVVQAYIGTSVAVPSEVVS